MNKGRNWAFIGVGFICVLIMRYMLAFTASALNNLESASNLWYTMVKVKNRKFLIPQRPPPPLWTISVVV